MVLLVLVRPYWQEQWLIIQIVVSSELVVQSSSRSILVKELEWLENFSLWLDSMLHQLYLWMR
jgi:hypothetical protein